jgi:hypothetical protein
MSGRKPIISSELRPFVDQSEADEIDRLAARLRDARPEPATAFRSALRSGLEQRAGGAWRPRRLRLTVLALAISGAAVLLFSLLTATGSGPLS